MWQQNYTQMQDKNPDPMSYSSCYKFQAFSGVQWADPGGTAIPGQPMTEPEQAPELYPLAKISLISKGGHASRIRY